MSGRILGSGADSARDNLIAIGAGVAASLLWPILVLCWNFNLAPFHLWREITSRLAVLEATVQQRADARAVADDLKACVIEGQRMAEQPDLFVKNLAAWYERCRTAVAQAGEAELAMYETFGQAPGTLVVQVAERQNVRDHVVKLRKIMARQYERAAELTAGQHPRRRR